MRRIEVDLARQTLTLFDATGSVLKRYSISSASKGAGERSGSERTPRGRHRIRALIGRGTPSGAVFRARRPTGEIWTAGLGTENPGRDWILSRILWLCGEEPGHNRGGSVDSQRRYIYIHGTPDDQPMGEPRSHGCLRMRNADVIELFELVEAGTPVDIRTGTMDALELRTGTWEQLAGIAFPIREEVFIREQGVPAEIEQDEWDARSLHVVALLAGKPVGTGRLLPDGHIGRLAVLASARGFGVGKVLMEALMAEAQKAGMGHVALNAQTHAEPFYAALGFVREGEEFMEAGIPHIAMGRAL